MAHIIPPEPEIVLYETGFDEGVDLLTRESTGKSLSELVMRIGDPLVVALDGGWGSGKSFFLKCWVGAHLKDHGDASQTVYFDAFEHDFIDSPLASLMGVLGDRLEPEKDKTGKTVTKKTLNTLRKAALPLTRLGLAVTTYGASEAVGALGDAILKQSAEELEKAAESFWARENGQRAAMAQFKQVLTELTAGEDAPKKLIVVIDELDRCRPDHALSLLEIIKHFFSVPNVHFVLGVNLEQLENSVKARYGAGIDAGLYLQKFVGLTMRLPDHTDSRQSYHKAIQYFEVIARQAGVQSQDRKLAAKVMNACRGSSMISLRSVQRLLTVIQLAPSPGYRLGYDEIEQNVVMCAAVMKVWSPKLYQAALNGTITQEDLRTIFAMDFTDKDGRNTFAATLALSWQSYLDPEAFAASRQNQPLMGVDPISDRIADMRYLIRHHLETFTFDNVLN